MSSDEEVAESSMGTRHGHGVFDCPMVNCHETIIGSYSDLVEHVRACHPLSRNVLNEEGESVLERVEDAQANALQRDIREQMCVGSKQNRPTSDDCHETNNG